MLFFEVIFSGGRGRLSCCNTVSVKGGGGEGKEENNCKGEASLFNEVTRASVCVWLIKELQRIV